jgi:hypothetical protein
MPPEPEASGAGGDARTLRWGVWILFGEAVVVTAMVLFLVYQDLTATADTANGPFAVTLYAAVMASLFAALGWSLRGRRAWARGPAIVLNLLLLPIGYSMVAGGLAWLGILVVAAGLGGAGTLLAPATRAALGMR